MKPKIFEVAVNTIAATTRKMGRPIVIAVQRATKQDHHGFVEVQPRISQPHDVGVGEKHARARFQQRQEVEPAAALGVPGGRTERGAFSKPLAKPLTRMIRGCTAST